MLVLSILIMLALGAAVVSFFIAGAQWLLLVSAALVLFAFYLSRRVPSSMAANDPVVQTLEPLSPSTTESPTATIDDQRPQSAQPRAADDATELIDTGHVDRPERPDLSRPGPDLDAVNRPPVRPETGHAIAS
jgi:hypothetical protein